MDFLVVGLGLGALAILGGIVMVTFLAWRAERAAQRATRSDEQQYHAAVVASRNAAGQALIAAGAVILLATVGAVAGSLDDRTGSLLVATTATVAAIGLVVRDFLYRARYPMPRRPRARPLETPLTDSPARTAPLPAVPVAVAPVAVATAGERQESETELDEAFVELVEEVVPEGDASETEPTVDEIAVPFALDEPAPSPEQVEVEVESAPAEEGAVIDVPYSFMRDDDPAAGARSAPYTFMNPDDPERASGEPGDTNGAEADLHETAAFAAAKPRPNRPGAGDKTRSGRPALRLVGKGRSPAP